MSCRISGVSGVSWSVRGVSGEVSRVINRGGQCAYVLFLHAAPLSRASISSARRFLLVCSSVHDVCLAHAMFLVVAFLSQIYWRLLGTHMLGTWTFTLIAWIRLAYVTVSFLCGRTLSDCPTCVGCGCTTCVRCGPPVRANPATSAPSHICETWRNVAQRCLIIKEMGPERSRINVSDHI